MELKLNWLILKPLDILLAGPPILPDHMLLAGFLLMLKVEGFLFFEFVEI
jgi:hypothetical protein